MDEYVKRLDAAFARGIIERSSLIRMDVTHSNDCGVYSDSICDCACAITLQTLDGDFILTTDGSLEPKVDH